MEVRFTPEQEAQLLQVAVHAGIATEEVVKDAALRVIAETARFRAAVQAGLAQADTEQLVEDDEVRLWLERQEQRS